MTKQLEYNALTGVSEMINIPDVIPTEDEVTYEPTDAERIASLEYELSTLKEQLTQLVANNGG
ncbi:MAG: hypothetical protein K6T94_22425 [Paenibacillus sp.]|nr:hypothetical protein [Paenibacillus sp.]